MTLTFSWHTIDVLTSSQIDIRHCSFLIDSQFQADSLGSTTLQPDFIGDSREGKSWERLECRRFMDVPATYFLARIFWVPDWSVIPTRYRRQWGTYCLMRRR